MKAFLRFTTFLLVVLSAAACRQSAARPSPVLCPEGGIDPSKLLPVAEQPKLEELFIPPLPIPQIVLHHRSTIRVVVDTVGRVMPDSVMVCGIPDTQYAQRVAERVAAVRFVPRRTPAGRVVAAAVLVHDF